MLEAASRISSFAGLVLLIAFAWAPDVSGQKPMGQDSLRMDVQWAEMPDSLLPGLEIELEAGGCVFHPSDSIEFSLLKGSSISVWARYDGGRLQFDHSLSRFQDTVYCTLGCDMLGCVMNMGSDTLRFLWRSQGAGCFPAVRDHEVERVLRDALSEPFESKRLARLQPWMMEQCLTLEQLRRCAAAFDDEERKLQLLRDASCTTPSHLHELGTVFASQRYRDRFLEWVQSRR
jgi:hypothetical protein